ncbi:TonB-dependent receptor [Flammeovirga agarivorans]|uniref:TonB-dependent receptor n=1 Tax=Flammeovirga agarivorans TaxID=2726742 RepID=A0A7X8SKG4_9BACT|nr:TonB-dependent receptor [Flammeovirga agarivorans]NLR91797.1 TonB-dependent receptor [Flammeovirga agarivorans]
MSRILTLLTLLLFPIIIHAGGIKGSVNGSDGEPLIGAVISIEPIHKQSIVGMDGTFRINDLPKGDYTIVVKYIGYKDLVKEVRVSSEGWVSNDLILQVDAIQLDEAVVYGTKERKTAESARATERVSSKVMTVVSAQDIELSPDLNVANVVQRVSGVSLERNNSGDGQFAIVRGMDKRYNYTLVNGVKIPSPDNKNRYVPLDLFPSDLLDRLEVTKALTPDMEGDAVGGVINMEMKDAPESYSGQLNLSIGNNTLFGGNNPFMTWNTGGNMTSPPSWNGVARADASDFSNQHLLNQYKNYVPNIVAGMSIGNRFMDDKLGVIVAGSYQQTARGSESTWFDTGMLADGSTSLDNMEDRNYYQLQKRMGLHAKMDYRINQDHSIQWYNAFVHLQNDQVRDVTRTRTWGSYDPINGNAGEMSYVTRYRSTIQQIFNSTLTGQHQLNPWFKADWSAVYSKASNSIPDNAKFTRSGSMNNWVHEPERIAGRSALTRRWDYNDDEDIALYTNFTFTPEISFIYDTEFKVGGLVRNKNRSNDFEQYRFNAGNRALVKGEDWNDITDVDWIIENPTGVNYSPNRYQSHENIRAAYGQFKFDFSNRFEVLGGVRMEHTDIGYYLPQPTNEIVENGLEEMNQTYVDFLPSIHFKYKISEKSNLRSSYFKSVIRPGFSEFVPIENGDTEDDWTEMGNPLVERTIGHNLDLRYELFPKGMDKFMIGGFYKKLINPIEYSLNRQAGYIMPDNYGDAENMGIEIDVVKYFNKFGISANYTYTHSSITTEKAYYERENPEDDTSDIVIRSALEERPLQGQAAHIANLSLLYKNTDAGLDVQLATVYTGDRIHSLSAFYGNDMWQRGFFQMDLSVEKRINPKTIVYLKAYNLLDNAYEVEIRQPINEAQSYFPKQGDVGDNVLVRQDFYRRQFLLGLKYNF